MNVDPSFVTPEAWSLLGKSLIYLVFFVASMIGMGLSMVFSLGFIPSLVASGHVPSSMGTLRLPLLVLGLLCGVSAVFMASQMLPDMVDALGTVYTRWFL
jgi:hypothetical protein